MRADEKKNSVRYAFSNEYWEKQLVESVIERLGDKLYSTTSRAGENISTVTLVLIFLLFITLLAKPCTPRPCKK